MNNLPPIWIKPVVPGANQPTADERPIKPSIRSNIEPESKIAPSEEQIRAEINGANALNIKSIPTEEKTKSSLDAKILAILTREKKHSETYISALLKLQDNGIKLTPDIVRNITIEKTAIPKFVETLIKLHNLQIKITPELVGGLEELRLSDDQYYVRLFVSLKIADEQNQQPKMNKTAIRVSDSLKFADKTFLESQTYKTTKGNRRLFLTPLTQQLERERLREQYLPIVKKMNEDEKARAQILRESSASELYNLLVFGREEVNTGNFRAIYGALESRIIKANKESNTGSRKFDLSSLLEKVDTERLYYLELLKCCVTFGRLELIDNIDSEQEKAQLIKKIVSDLPSSRDKKADAVCITEIMISAAGGFKERGKSKTIEDAKLSQALEQALLDAYNKAEIKSPNGNSKMQRLYGAIGSIYFTATGRTNFKVFNDMYPVIQAKKVQQSELLNTIDGKPAIVHQVYTYNDADGKQSFSSMIKDFKTRNWKLDNSQENYITLTKTKNGITHYIYVNRPEKGIGSKKKESEGVRDIKEVFNKLNLTSIIVTHVGHSTWSMETIKNLSENVRVIDWRACGGEGQTLKIAEMSPDADVYSTKEVGTKTVNEAVMMSMTESSFNPTLNWEAIYEYSEQKTGNNPHFPYYVPPYENVPLMLSRLLQNEPDKRQSSIEQQLAMQ